VDLAQLNTVRNEPIWQSVKEKELPAYLQVRQPVLVLFRCKFPVEAKGTRDGVSILWVSTTKLADDSVGLHVVNAIGSEQASNEQFSVSSRERGAISLEGAFHARLHPLEIAL